MKDPELRYFVKENENIHVIGKDVILTVDGENVEFDLVACPHCEGLFAVESYYPNNVSSISYCPFCRFEVGIEDKHTFLGNSKIGP